MRNIAAANVEEPCDVVRIRNEHAICAIAGDFCGCACELRRCRFTCFVEWMQFDGRQGRSGAIGPHAIDRIVIDGHQNGAKFRAGRFITLYAIKRVQMWIITQAHAGLEMRFKPMVWRIIDEMFAGKGLCVGLLACLCCVAAINKKCCGILQGNSDAP